MTVVFRLNTAYTDSVVSGSDSVLPQNFVLPFFGDIYTISVNLAGLPGISIPVGQDAKGLPVGMQLIGDCFQEKKLFQAAYTYECLTEKKWVSMYDKTEAAGKEEA